MTLRCIFVAVIALVATAAYADVADAPQISRPSIDFEAYATTTDLVEEVKDKVPDDVGGIYCSCVLTARAYGADIPSPMNADQLEPNNILKEGGVVIMRYWSSSQGKWIYHVAVITKFTGSGFWIVEGNKKHCQKTERLVAWGSKEIYGFWAPES